MVDNPTQSGNMYIKDKQEHTANRHSIRQESHPLPIYLLCIKKLRNESQWSESE